ncbi:PAS domain S-box-containing protein [Bacillus ectoiniformans]|uniref:PAS domain-containing sensor histidine kinase n=1 Tax=Bacillus ectoiniformans TaxID=1494429 RepID=UPI00195A13A5|nr:PAS domain-containing sensor histidine kinase [Bacillus ectoiniformans]MBM7649612.1 PAS domain S-box-containing protein [Bacillus ectoiniformans]
MKWYKSHIFWKVFLINLALIFSILTLMFIVSRIMLPEIVQVQYREITDKSVLRTKEQISIVVRDIESLSDYVQSKEAFRSGRSSDWLRELDTIGTISPFIDSATITDSQGRVVGYYPEDIKSIQNYDLSKRKYVKRTFETKKPYLSDVVSADTNRYIIVLSVPIIENGQVIRLVNLSLRIADNENFQSIFQTSKIGEKGSTFIVDRNGRVISHPEKSKIGEDEARNPVVKKLLQAESGYMDGKNEDGFDAYASYEYVPVLDWGVVAQIPKAEIYQPYQIFQQSLWTISVVVFILLSLLTALYARQMIRPIRRLYNAVDRVAQGDFSQQVKEIDNSEIGALSSRFNEMTQYIRKTKSDLQMKEEQLKEQKVFLRKVIDMNPSFIYAIDRQGCFTLVNESFADFLGVEADDLVGKKMADYSFKLQPDSEAAAHGSLPSIIFEEEFVGCVGKNRWVETVKLPIYSSSYGIDQMLYVSTDITERKQAEEWMRKSEKLTVVGELAAGVAHEIRNPLTSIKGFIHLLKEENDERKSYFDIIESELERINLIVNEFLVLGKPQAMKFEKKNLSLLINDVMTLLSAQANLNGVHMRPNFTEGIPLIYCDENQLKQVFINIIKNAIEAMPAGGCIWIDTYMNGDQLVASIKDEGAGISEDRLEKLGEPFYSTKEKGTGLGLMVSFKILEAHGGTVHIESKVGEGTHVELAFPIKKEEA